ncbi:hypothetical protein DYQ86_08700 [Acidobacteria bacterium AB60]|nr:hypothetical protein DYQ86_08700 [Acidobacteria bacterium AB60]
MSIIGHDVEIVERSPNRVVVEVTPSIPIVVLFSASALLALILTITAPTRAANNYWISAAAMVFFASFAISGSIRSTFAADRRARELMVTRKILFWTYTSSYVSGSIDRVFVRETQKGSALRLRLKSGRVRRLTLWHDFRSARLEGAAVALNEMLRHRTESKSPEVTT